MPDEKHSSTTPYLVALRRDKRTHAPKDWIERLKKTPGVSVDDSSSNRRVMINADADTIQQVIDGFGDFCYVEPLIKHRLSETDDV